MFAVTLEGILNDSRCEVRRSEVVDFHRFAFQLLVILKKPAQHRQPMDRQLAGFLETVEFGVVNSDRQNTISQALISDNCRTSKPPSDQQVAAAIIMMTLRR